MTVLILFGANIMIFNFLQNQMQMKEPELESKIPVILQDEKKTSIKRKEKKGKEKKHQIYGHLLVKRRRKENMCLR